jgi:hypothetical protein
MPPVLDLIGRRFGRLVVLSRAEHNEPASGSAMWVCACDCGSTCEVSSSSLNRPRGNTSSCGCKKRQTARAQSAHARRCLREKRARSSRRHAQTAGRGGTSRSRRQRQTPIRDQQMEGFA